MSGDAPDGHPPFIDHRRHPRRVERKEPDAMFHPDQHTSQPVFPTQAVVDVPVRSRACLVEGCPCKDARIVSHRRAAFWADLARRTGATADRVIARDADWDWTSSTTGVDA
jgi:hypothetical protein